MAVPKRKTSKSRIHIRKRAQKLSVNRAQTCVKCGAPQLPHRVCPSCGQYRGKQVVTVVAE
jgi:large subunit ribosomal protein L32